jgi:hypothetical protein
MGKRAFRGAELNQTEGKSGDRGKGVDLHLRRGVQEWRQRHLKYPTTPTNRVDVMNIYIYLSTVKFNSLRA